MWALTRSLTSPWWLTRPKSRAHELRALRQALQLERRRRRWAKRPASDLAWARRALIDAQGELTACSVCARHCDLPHGRWSGGFCCGGSTETLFTRDELAGLASAGVCPGDLRPPAGLNEQAGCAFRGPRGCSLAAQHRPSICLGYLCGDVGRELAAKGRGLALGALSDALQRAFEAFVRGLHDRPFVQPPGPSDHL